MDVTTYSLMCSYTTVNNITDQTRACQCIRLMFCGISKISNISKRTSMVVGTRLLSLNRSTKQSRLLSVATSHCRSQSTLSHLVHLSDQIYAENPTLYKCLRPPDINFRPLVAEGESEHEEAMISDWNEVLDTVQGMRVVPEMADQLSGAIYMHALMQEDVTCKCIRVSDHIDMLSSHQLSCVVDNICLWKALNLEDVHRSDMLQLILEKVDIRMCILQPSSDPRLTHTYCRLVNFFHAANCNYVGKAFRTMASEATSREQIVRLLLLAAFCNNSSRTPITVQKELMRLLAVQIDIMFDSMTQSELAVCFAGLNPIVSSREVTKLGDKVAKLYGFKVF